MDFHDLFDHLNAEQIKAVTDQSRNCVVKAHVGSGKTTVLIAKVFYLHEKENIPFNEMVVLTFTNKAANEIKNRLIAHDPWLTEKDLPYFGTFHSVALKLLRTVLDVESIGYDTSFTVMDPDEELFMAQSLIESQRLMVKYSHKLNRRLEMAEKGNFDFGKIKVTDDMPKLFELMAEEKKKQKKMNFNDLIHYATMLLEKSDFSANAMIVDEFQDTSNEQLTFMRAMLGQQSRFFAVGDPNQIIYTWRGSNREMLNRFVKECDATELTLSSNYRSCGTILEVAKSVLKNASDLKGVKQTGDQIIIQNHYDPFNEAHYLANKIASLKDNGVEYQDIAIFYRTQRQAKILEDVFSKNQIPYEVSIKKNIKDVPVLNWFVKLLKASTNHNDLDNAIAVLSEKNYGLHISRREAKNLVSALNKDEALIDKESNTNSNASSFLLKINEFQKWCQRNFDLSDMYDYFELDSYINPTSAFFEEDKQYIQNLILRISDYIVETRTDLYTGIQNFINSSALFGLDILMKDDIQVKDSVKLMTLHAAKGLEFDYVFIIGVNDGLIPLHVSNPEEFEEEKRLFFVGITRAKNHLELSYYTAPDGKNVLPGESRYISMIPSHLILKEDQQITDGDLQQYRHEISHAIKKAASEEKDEEKAENNIEQKVEHPKYGIGTVIEDNGDIITVSFEGYGTKEFMKAFNEVKYL